MENKDAVIALDNGKLAGFVTSKVGRRATMSAHSGLIVLITEI
jgi:hypothetical protein